MVTGPPRAAVAATAIAPTEPPRRPHITPAHHVATRASPMQNALPQPIGPGTPCDLAGRMFRNTPAPTHLVVPPHHDVSATRILVGDDGTA